MKKMLMCFVLLNGCHHFDRLTGGQTKNNEIVILVSGQSNGVSPVQGNLSPVYSITGMVSVVHESVGISQPTTPTKQRPMIYDAAWIMLGDMLATKTNRPVKIVNVAFGNTSTRAWQKHIPELKREVKDYQPDIVLWIQGESDQVDNIPSEESYQNMLNIINSSRSEKFNLPWYVALDGFPHDWDYANADQMAIRITQRKLIKEGIVYQGPDIDLMRVQQGDNWFEHVSNFNNPGAEFSGDGLKAHAQSWYQIINNIF